MLYEKPNDCPGARSIAFVMGLVFFGFSMVVAYTAFYTDEKAAKILKFFSRPTSVAVGFDPNCGICLKVAKWVRRLDWFNVIQNDNALDPWNRHLAAAPALVRIDRMTAASLDQEEFVSGYGAVLVIVRRIPILMPLYPLFWLFGYFGFGDSIYDWIAVKSQWRRSCAEGVCKT